MAKLIFIGGKFDGRVYELAVQKTTVGRGEHNTLTLHDASVSQTHCEILVHGPEVILRDLGSSNGTVVNGERLRNEQRQLKGGQTVKFGSVEARLELEQSSGSDTATGVTAIFSHVRHLREHENEPKKPAALPTSFKSDPQTDVADHTIVVSRPPAVPETIGPPNPEKPGADQKPSKKLARALIVAALVLGLVVLVWIIRGRQ